MLKENASAFAKAKNILLGPKYEEAVVKALSAKLKSKELLEKIIHQKGAHKMEFGGRSPYFKTSEKIGRECSHQED